MNEAWAFWHIHVKIIDIKQDQDFVSPLISPKSSDSITVTIEFHRTR